MSTVTLIRPELTLSMKQIARENPILVRELLDEYYPKLERAFPLVGEIETKDTYLEYLEDEEFSWDMVLLRNSQREIIGGIQFQVLEIGGACVRAAAWAEHIWVEQENRSFDNFRCLLKIAEEKIQRAGADLVFMEFNNPQKMSQEEMAEDAEGGITTQDREKIWGRVGINVLLLDGEIAPYAQPSMDGQPPVEYLSLGFISSVPLEGTELSVEDYLRIAHTAHLTIPGVTLDDVTIKEYTNQVSRSGAQSLVFASLAELAASRTATAA
jgi:hypothetical protein